MRREKVPMREAHGLVCVFRRAGIFKAELAARSGVSKSSIYRIWKQEGTQIDKGVYNRLVETYKKMRQTDPAFSKKIDAMLAEIEESKKPKRAEAPAPMDYEATIREIADHYGLDGQNEKAVEEMAELIVAIKHLSKLDENEVDHYLNYVEELADVKIMVDQLVYLADRDLPESMQDMSVKRQIDHKLSRQLERIKKEKVTC